MIPVRAPRFDATECNTELEREFIEALHARAVRGGWYADSWPRADRFLLSVTILDQLAKCVVRTLRVDFDGVAVTFGDDETHQFVTNLDPSQGAAVVSGLPITELADIAANWLEREMHRHS
jgi:hypothetical protein